MTILLYGYKIHTCRFIEERREISGFGPLVTPFSSLHLPQPGLIFSAVLHRNFLWLQNNKMLPLFVINSASTYTETGSHMLFATFFCGAQICTSLLLIYVRPASVPPHCSCFSRICDPGYC